MVGFFAIQINLFEQAQIRTAWNTAENIFVRNPFASLNKFLFEKLYNFSWMCSPGEDKEIILFPVPDRVALWTNHSSWRSQKRGTRVLRQT